VELLMIMLLKKKNKTLNKSRLLDRRFYRMKT